MPLLFVRPAAAVVAAALLSGCGIANPRSETAAPQPAEMPVIETGTMASSADEPDLSESIAILTEADGAAVQAGRDRCLAAPPHLERALAERGGEDDEPEEEELSEEELEQTYAPEFATVDGVAAPDERPPLAPMTGYDPTTASFEELDRLIAFCIENDVVSEAELFGEDGDDDWCAELADIPLEEVREFAAEEGEDVVREEFEACGLANPLDS